MPRHDITLPDGTELTIITMDDRTTDDVERDLRKDKCWLFKEVRPLPDKSGAIVTGVDKLEN